MIYTDFTDAQNYQYQLVTLLLLNSFQREKARRAIQIQ